MPKVIVYVPAAAWKKLEERGLDPARAVREFAKRGYEIESSGAAVGDQAVSGSVPCKDEEEKESHRSDFPRPERAAPDSRSKNYRSEPFSLVCSNRAKHEPGVYCPECKGDGGR